MGLQGDHISGSNSAPSHYAVLICAPCSTNPAALHFPDTVNIGYQKHNTGYELTEYYNTITFQA